MEINRDIKEFTIDKKVEPWKLMCEEMTAWFNQNCYWLPHKFPVQKVNDVYFQLRKEGDRDFSHLMQRLHHS